MDAPDPDEWHQYLQDLTYPATRAEIVACARGNGAPDDVVSRLENIEDQSYDSREAVSTAVSLEGGTTMRYGHVTIYDQ